MDLQGSIPDGETVFPAVVPRGNTMPFPGSLSDEQVRELVPGEPVGVTVPKNGAPSGEGLVVETDLEHVLLRCGKCSWCANDRRRMWERAGRGWLETSPLSLFGTLTFSDEYFRERWNGFLQEAMENAVDAQRDYATFDEETLRASYVERMADRYDAGNPEHEAFMRDYLTDERQRLVKRLQKVLTKPENAGLVLRAHVSVYEYGDVRDRLHIHFLMHFDVEEARVEEAYKALRAFFHKGWFEWGIGRYDLQKVRPGDDWAPAAYLFQYLMKYQVEAARKSVVRARSRIAPSIGYRRVGTELYFAGRPELVPGGSLRPVEPIPIDREGTPLRSVGDVDREELEPSADSLRAAGAFFSDKLRKVADEIARARLAWSNGELWPGWSDGLDRPADLWAEIPPDEWEFAGYLKSRWWKENDLFRADLKPEGGDGDGTSHAGNGAVVPSSLRPLDGEVLGPTTSTRAQYARGLGPNTVIRRDGTYTEHPDDVLRKRRILRRGLDGSLIDAETGEVIHEG